MDPVNDVVLRPAVRGDAGAVAAIWHLGWQDGHRGHVPDALTAVRTEASFHERAEARIVDTTDTVVAEIDGTVVGFTMTHDDEVEQVYIDAAHRGSGLVGQLLDDAEARVAAAGFDEAWLAVVAGNARARRAYERHGWRDAGAFDHAAPGPDGSIPVPSQRYVKALRPA